MQTTRVCAECGAILHKQQTCQEHFHQMLAWEFENPGYGVVHHLMVLCYHLQHPSLYSPEGLNGAIQLLADFVERGASPEKVRKHNQTIVNSHTRTWKIKGTPASHGVYDPPMQWKITATNVIESGVENYCDSVRTWAQSVHETFKASSNSRSLSL